MLAAVETGVRETRGKPHCCDTGAGKWWEGMVFTFGGPGFLWIIFSSRAALILISEPYNKLQNAMVLLCLRDSNRNVVSHPSIKEHSYVHRAEPVFMCHNLQPPSFH